MSDELKPCPFCGKRVKHHPCNTFRAASEFGFPDWWIICECGIRTPIARGEEYTQGYGTTDTELEAKEMLNKLWNSRPIEDALRSKLAIAVEALEGVEIESGGFAEGVRLIAKEALAKIRS